MKTVFFDVDTQLDFLYPAGSLYVPGAEKLVPTFAKLANYAKSNGIPVISTADAHEENDAEFEVWKPHCVVGTAGQQKSAATLVVQQPSILRSRSRSKAEPGPQIIVEKQHTDCFTNPNLASLLASLDAERYVVYGVVSEVCVRFALFGLLHTTHARVELLTDAIRHLKVDAYEAMLREFEAENGHLTTVSAVI